MSFLSSLSHIVLRPRVAVALAEALDLSKKDSFSHSLQKVPSQSECGHSNSHFCMSFAAFLNHRSLSEDDSEEGSSISSFPFSFSLPHLHLAAAVAQVFLCIMLGIACRAEWQQAPAFRRWQTNNIKHLAKAEAGDMQPKNSMRY